MTWNEMICHRESCRSFTGSPADAGVALAYLYAAHEETFRFFNVEIAPGVSGYYDIGSVIL